MTAWEQRLESVAGEYRLDEAQHAALAVLLRLVRDDPAAPTTVRDPAAAVDVHVADSLVALGLTAVRAANSIADLGAGAGFPGLPLALALPGARVSLVESSSRKCTFLRDAVAETGAMNAEVVCDRAESWAARDLEVVTARAVAPLAVLVEYAAPLLALGGTFVAWKARVEPDEARAGGVAARELGLEVGEVVDVTPFPGAQDRTLHLYSKVADTPPRFPRRPGMARKRPLSG